MIFAHFELTFPPFLAYFLISKSVIFTLIFLKENELNFEGHSCKSEAPNAPYLWPYLQLKMITFAHGF